MASRNRVELIGYLGADPEIRVMPNGDYVAHLSIATSEEWLDKHSNEKKKRVEWHKVILFRRIAEVAKQYLHKGSLVAIDGKLRTRKYEDKDGIERYVTEIHGDELLMLDRQNSGAEETKSAVPVANTESPKSQPQQNVELSSFDENIPF